MSLSLIYHFQSSQNQDESFTPASYKVIYFFSEQGFLEKEFLGEMARAIPEANQQHLTFLNLEELKSYALRVCEELQVPEVRLISVQDYNIGLDGGRDLATFQSIFTKFGDVIVNEGAVKKKGFLGKFFS